MSLRTLLKITLFPLSLAITIFTGVMKFLLRSTIVNKVFGSITAVLLIAFVALTWSAIFVKTDMSLIARLLIPSLALLLSFIFNPFSGVLKYLRLLIERIESFNKHLKI